MFDRTYKESLKIPDGPYPKCTKCGGTLLPVIVPPVWETFMSCSLVRTADETLAWKCSGCGRELAYGKDDVSRNDEDDDARESGARDR